jgi:hypothetical protein
MSGAVYVPALRCVLFALSGPEEGVNFLVPEYWTITAIANHLKELQEFLS